MADTQVLGTCVFGRAGSSPASRTQHFKFYFRFDLLIGCSLKSGFISAS